MTAVPGDTAPASDPVREPHAGPPNTNTSTLAGSVLLAGFVSPGFLTVAVLEYSPANIAVSVRALTTISGKLAPTARLSVRLQVNERFPLAPEVHVQPSVLATLPDRVNPFGSVSSTVVVHVAVTGPSLRTTNL